MDFTTWGAFVAASVALLMIPGPTVLLVLAYALGQGRRVAVPTALGVATGDLVAMSASLLGLGALVLTSAILFFAMKWVGAIYLIWLGLRMIRGASATGASISKDSLPTAPGQAFANAATVTALNPKSIIFFVAFVPHFIDPTQPFMAQAAILVATFVGLAAINALLYALAAGHMRDRLRKPVLITGLTRLGGGVLIAMGIATAFIRKSQPV